MIQTIIFSFLAGLFGANGIPHFVKGVTGQKHQTPFGKPSSAVVNVAWGWFNFVVAALLWRWAHPLLFSRVAFICFAVGALVIAVFSALYWEAHPEHNAAKR
jgi:hypothetical protein